MVVWQVLGLAGLFFQIRTAWLKWSLLTLLFACGC